MPRKRSAVDTRPKLSEDEFSAKYRRETEEGEAADRRGEGATLAELVASYEKGESPERGESPIRSALAHLDRWWLVRQLRAAAKENSPEAYKLRLDYFLCRWLQAEPPEGVLTPWPKRPGRRRKPETQSMYFMWCDLSKPSLHKKTLAEAYFGKKFTTASPIDRTRMIDRCRRAVQRYQQTLRVHPD